MYNRTKKTIYRIRMFNQTFELQTLEFFGTVHSNCKYLWNSNVKRRKRSLKH